VFRQPRDADIQKAAKEQTKKKRRELKGEQYQHSSEYRSPYAARRRVAWGSAEKLLKVAGTQSNIQ
jgi:hypothetical protein